MLEVVLFREDFYNGIFTKIVPSCKSLSLMIFMRMTLFKNVLLGNIQADALRHYLQADAAYLKIHKLICFVNSKNE